jgi:hypothetical protein
VFPHGPIKFVRVTSTGLLREGTGVRSYAICGPGSFVLLCMLCMLCGCAGYDSALLDPPSLCGDAKIQKGELCDTAIPEGAPGACPTACEPGEKCAPLTLVGQGCQRQCAAVPVSRPVSGDGCCPVTASAIEDSDCGSCGDGVIGPSETCDPIESCPTRLTCETEMACIVGVFSGDPAKCTARCELKTISDCRSEDGCCPAGCNASNDSDCSTSCGNGIVDIDAGETCESSTGTNPCPQSCDDHDVCTFDLMTGSSQNCNARCTFPPILQPANDDQCCPLGASALNDNDCRPSCGNGIAEPGEECDGGDLCTAECKALTREQHECQLLPTTALPACQQCSCMRCSAEMLGCYSSGQKMRDELCTTVIECANRTSCAQSSCYCGTSSDCSAPNGACRAEVETAAGSTYRPNIVTCTTTESCALYWSTAIGDCRQAQCPNECWPQAPSTTGQ